MSAFVWLIPVLAACALVFAAYKAAFVSKANPGNPRMQEIAAAIAEGADAFLKSEYRILAIFIAVLSAIQFRVTREREVCDEKEQTQ